MKAFVFAAGRGERMRPLTDSVPKPLLRAGGKALVVWQLEALARAGICEVIVNVSHLGQQLRDALGDGSDWGLQIEYSEEGAEPLETAGGLRHALELLGSEPFLTVNADVWCDVDLATLLCPPEGLAHLLLVDNPPHHPNGDFSLRDGRVGLKATPKLTFSGYAVYRPELLSGLAPGKHPLRPVLRAAVAGGQVTGMRHQGAWFDIGTPERLLELDRMLQKPSGPGDHRLNLLRAKT